MLLGILLLIPSFTTGQVSKYSAYRDAENGRHLPAAADDGSSSYKEQQRSPRASGNLPEDLVSGKHLYLNESNRLSACLYVCVVKYLANCWTDIVLLYSEYSFL